MSKQQRHTVVCIDGSCLSAVLVEVSKSGEHQIKCAIREEIQSLAPSDPAEGAERVRRALDEAGIPRSRLTLVLPRHEVIIKQISIQCGDFEDAELAPMVRLKLGRESTQGSEPELVDYSVISRENQTATVLAAAVKESRTNYLLELFRLAGRKVSSIRVRTDGLASYLDPAETALAISAGPSGYEFAVIDRGVVVFSRACVDATTPEQVCVEADRTIISSRTSDPTLTLSPPILVAQTSRSYPADWRHVTQPSLQPELSTPSKQTDLMLLGIAVEAEGPHRIDFLNPHTPRDLGAQARQKVMLVALVLIAMIGTSYVLGKNQTDYLDDSISVAQASLETEFTTYMEGLAAQARYRHEKEWVEARVDWAGHLERLIHTLPEPGAVILNEITMRAETRITFAPGEKSALPGLWGRDHLMRIQISGTSDSRASIERLRESMLTLGELSINGADTETDFSLVVTTSEPSPREATHE